MLILVFFFIAFRWIPLLAQLSRLFLLVLILFMKTTVNDLAQWLDLSLLRFRFQAEDGIRDWSVTGVQTCALPISSRRRHTRLVSDWSSDVCSSDLDRLNEEVRQILIDHQDEMRRTSVSYQEMYKKVKQQ